MNSASGVNEGYNFVQFDDGTKIQVSGPPGQISGLVYGDRKITLTKKSICFDSKNLILCEMAWGKNTSNRDQFCKYNDYCFGKVVQLKQGTSCLNLHNIKNKDIQKELGTISGRFTKKIYYNDEVIFDVENLTPFFM